jgi:[ribosomal protein S5]-alanine N-acetyltransferase
MNRLLSPFFSTVRLVLRPLVPNDLEDVLAYATSPGWGKYLPVPQPYTLKDATTFIDIPQVDDTSGQRWGMEYEGHIVGAINFHYEVFHHRAEIGYSLLSHLWGRGIVHEAAKKIVDESFTTFDPLNRIQATAHPDNKASIRVMEKLGMSKEAHLRKFEYLHGKVGDKVIYSLLREDWRDNEVTPHVKGNAPYI